MSEWLDAKIVKSSKTRKLVLNVCEYFEREKKNKGPLVDLNDVIKRTSKACHVPEAIVRKFVKKAKRLNGVVALYNNETVKLDSAGRAVIRQHIQDYYLRGRIPTTKKLLVSLKQAGLFEGGKASLKAILRDLNFEHRILGCKGLYLERSDVRHFRCQCLRKLISIDQRNAVYLKETLVEVKYSMQPDKAPEQVNGTPQEPVTKCLEFIAYHAGSVKGFVPGVLMLLPITEGISSDDLDGTRFKTWFIQTFLPNIPMNSVIVLDNEEHHSTQVDMAPNWATSKEKIFTWLRSHDIPCTDDLLKPELLELTKLYKCRTIIYEVDEIAKKLGHKVIRLPPDHSHYNPLEFVWAGIKEKVEQRPDPPGRGEAQIVFREAILRMSPRDWQRAISQAESLWRRDWENEKQVDQALDNLLKDLEEDDYTSSDYSFSSGGMSE